MPPEAPPRRNPVPATLLAVVTLLSGGCSNLGGPGSPSRQQIMLVSEPPGASVLADGIEIGSTPLAFSPGETFRSGFVSSESAILGYRYVGKLAVRKPGCRDYVTEVDDNLLSKDIHVQLECDPDYQPPPAPAAPPQASGVTGSPEQRLRRIEDLHDKGLLSDEEYRQLRQRVLDTL